MFYGAEDLNTANLAEKKNENVGSMARGGEGNLGVNLDLPVHVSEIMTKSEAPSKVVPPTWSLPTRY